MDNLDFPEMRRRWNVTIFRNERVEGGVQNTVVQEYKNVRTTNWVSGEIVGYDGTLKFTDETGKEIVASSVPFLADSVTQLYRFNVALRRFDAEPGHSA